MSNSQLKNTMTDYTLPRSNPFQRGNWHGSTLDWTGKKVDDLPNNLKAIAYVLWASETRMDGNCDGKCAAIVLLKDGRFASWESQWGPTGHGFDEDAYGGEAMVTITETVADAIRLGLSRDNQAAAARALRALTADQSRKAFPCAMNDTSDDTRS